MCMSVWGSPFLDHMGIEVLARSDGYSELRLPVREHLLNSRSTVQGGVLATLIDAAVGSAVSSTLEPGQEMVTVELKINYLHPGKGEYLIARGRMHHRGRTLAVGIAEIENPEGKKVAMGTATFMML